MTVSSKEDDLLKVYRQYFECQVVYNTLLKTDYVVRK